MKLSHRRQFLHLAAGAAALSAVSQIASAQTYPSRPITMIVPFAAGGGTDVSARIISEHISRTLGQQIVIENIVGAGGTTGSTRAMRANPDEYTIEMGQMGTHATAVALYPNLAYKPDIDFAPIGLVMWAPVMIVARKDFPSNDPQRISRICEVKRSEIEHRACGGWLNRIQLRSTVQLDYWREADIGILQRCRPGHERSDRRPSRLHVRWGINNSVPHVQSGTIKAYAIGSEHRSPVLPNVPTSKEAGLPEFQVSGWLALFAPRGTPKPILEKLTDALDEALEDDTSRKRLLDLGTEIPDQASRGQQPLAAFVKSEIARWTPIIKAANVKPD
jgi:tripartite-type tricarboxylate transporter receptor subunit TctC